MGLHLQVSQIHQAESPVLSTAASTQCLLHFLRGDGAGTHVAHDEVLGKLFLGPPEPKD